MSSIYDALQRIQGEKGSWASPTGKAGAPSSRKKMVLLVFVSVLAGSLFTGGVFYAVRVLGGDAGTGSAAASAQAAREVKPAEPPRAAGRNAVTSPGTKPVAPPVEARASSSHPENVEGYLDLGERYYLEKDYEKALQTYTEAVHYYSSDARILNNLGSVYLAMGQTGRAIHYYQESRNASKDFVEPVYNLACAYAILGDKARAISNLKLAGSMNPEAKQWAASDPDLKGLKGSAEFDRIMRAR